MAFSENHYEYIIIGGGSAGIPLSHALAHVGHSVALIEEKHLGGSCINFGCTPTKHVIASAKLAYDARRASEFGLDIPTIRVHFGDVIQSARQLVQTERETLRQGFQNQPNLNLISGRAKLAGKDAEGRFQVKVGDQIFTSEQVILDTGSRSDFPKIEGLSPEGTLNSENWLEMSELPPKIAILGSGYIGLEMGQFYRRMGSEVYLIEPHSRILKREDSDISNEILKLLQEEGIHFQLNSELKKVEGSPGSYRLHLNSETLDVTHLFVAIGRKANTDNLGLESLGIQPTSHGFIKCDSKLRTQVQGLWVAGDIRGGPLFTHSSWDDFRILRSQILENGPRTTDRIVPYSIFIDPELGRVGLTEQEARAQSQNSGTEVSVVTFPFSDNLKAMELREAKGLIKLVVDLKSELILGAAILGPMAAELIHLYSTLMSSKMPYSVIRDEIIIHPTLTEAIQSAVLKVPVPDASSSKKVA